ncbi:uncharacterized protein G2W53_037534 [Senna tora]|uniref:Uncharacterized protein n=1 Tax=Senna tora TaxID=362788 RepID=A0A834SJJ2_9FABA|nr:uncharacterized protein G2W53_037534 [Senna tora]
MQIKGERNRSHMGLKCLIASKHPHRRRQVM